MSENTVEAIIGAGVVLVAGAFLVYLSQTTGFGGTSGDYALTAKFRSAEGLVVGADVRVAGVKVGSVTQMTLDPVTYLAETKLSVADGVEIPDDSLAAVASEGLLGGAFVQIEPGGSEFTYVAGDEILDTQSAVSLLDLMMRFATSGSSE